MQKYESECCGCDAPGYPCLEDSCPRLHVLHLYCDECGKDVEELFGYEGKEICEECLHDHTRIISI